MAVKITIEPFGVFEGKQVQKFSFVEDNGISVSIINYGAKIISITTPDKNGNKENIVIGFGTMEEYIEHDIFYIGGVCGRYAGRINKGNFLIDGKEYFVSTNVEGFCLHGGFKGFDRVYWDATVLPEGDGVAFSYLSKDGEEGFPGNLKVTVTYRVRESAVHISYHAATDKATPINLTNHSYFNLSAKREKNILNHHLQLNGTLIAEVNENLIPTGRFIPVANTELEFSALRRIGEASAKLGEFDHSWLILRENAGLEEAATIVDIESGRKLTVYTTTPAVHFYSGYYLEHGKLGKYAGLCIETQHFGDSPNRPEFPNTILYPGKEYRQETVFQFSVMQ